MDLFLSKVSPPFTEISRDAQLARPKRGIPRNEDVVALTLRYGLRPGHLDTSIRRNAVKELASEVLKGRAVQAPSDRHTGAIRGGDAPAAASRAQWQAGFFAAED